MAIKPRNQWFSKIRSLYVGLHWRDVVAISLFFLILTIAFFFFLRRAQYIDVRIRITQNDVLKNYRIWDMAPLWYANVLKPGMSESDILGRKLITILAINSGVAEDNDQLVYVDLRIKALYNSRTKEYSYNGLPLLVGSHQRFKVNGIQLPGIIHAVGDLGRDPFPQKSYLIRGFLDPRNNEVSVFNQTNQLSSLISYTGVYKFISNKLQIGSQVKNDQKVLAQITEIKKTPALKRVIDNGREWEIPDPQRESIEMALTATVNIIDGKPYFKEDQNRLILGGAIPLDFSNVKGFMTIT